MADKSSKAMSCCDAEVDESRSSLSRLPLLPPGAADTPSIRQAVAWTFGFEKAAA